jgi:hypothetical protein
MLVTEASGSEAICLGIVLSEVQEGEHKTRVWFPEELDASLIQRVVDWAEGLSPSISPESLLVPSVVTFPSFQALAVGYLFQPVAREERESVLGSVVIVFSSTFADLVIGNLNAVSDALRMVITNYSSLHDLSVDFRGVYCTLERFLIIKELSQTRADSAEKEITHVIEHLLAPQTPNLALDDLVSELASESTQTARICSILAELVNLENRSLGAMLQIRRYLTAIRTASSLENLTVLVGGMDRARKEVVECSAAMQNLLTSVTLDEIRKSVERSLSLLDRHESVSRETGTGSRAQRLMAEMAFLTQ